MLYDILDGQKRINVTKSYTERAFTLLNPNDNIGFRFPNFMKNDPCPWAGKRFSEFSDDFQCQLEEHKILVYEINTHNENSIRDLFIVCKEKHPLSFKTREIFYWKLY